jgi:hypothetical protein
VVLRAPAPRGCATAPRGRVLLSLQKVRALLAGRVAEEELEARSHELLAAAMQKRLGAGQSVVVPVVGFDPAERDRLVRLAHASGRSPRHLILIETAREQVLDEERPGLDELRRALDAGELGNEGFHTALRLGGASLGELKRIVFQREPRED